jgi:hypothetical protein
MAWRINRELSTFISGSFPAYGHPHFFSDFIEILFSSYRDSAPEVTKRLP